MFFCISLVRVQSSDSHTDDSGLPSTDGFDDDDDFLDGGGGGGGDVDNGFDAAPSFSLHAADGGDEETDQWDAGLDRGVKDFTATQLDSSLAHLSKSYEELCKEHVEAYLRSAESFVASTTLSRRVMEWQEKLLPLLEMEETHATYDIVSYGREILHTVDEQKDVDSCLSFDSAVRGKPQWEICRMFLATLQLANNGNLALAAAPMTMHPDAHSLSLKLLSMDDKCMEAIGAASDARTGDATHVYTAAATASAAPQKKNKTNKRKANAASAASTATVHDAAAAIGDENAMVNSSSSAPAIESTKGVAEATEAGE